MNVLVVSVHPDDETLGAAGAILKHKANGDRVVWLIVTHVLKDFGFSEERILEREKEIEAVKQAFGFDAVENLKYPTMMLDNTSLLKMVPEIGNIIHKHQCETIYTVNRSDAHSDHRIVFDAVMANTKSFRFPFIKKVLMYECISETEFAPALAEKAFVPNYFIDISPYLGQKLEIMSIFASEMGEHPFPRSKRNIEALATFRGAQCGVEYAEAFQLLKYIDK